MPTLTTTYSDVVDHFAKRSDRAAAELEKWRSSPDKAAAVVPHVESAATRVIYDLTLADVERVAETTEHALGTVARSVAEGVTVVRDWHPAFALQHALHHAAETLGQLPTYQQFRDFCATDRAAATMLLDPARRIRDVAKAAGYEHRAANDAVRWRVGNAYYAYLKEIYALVVLRAAGIDARYHVLADALFRTDLWVDDLCISLYVGNQFFRAEGSGRKPHAEALLGDGPFRFAHLEFAARAEFGNVHLPDRSDLESRVRAAMAEPVVELDAGQRFQSRGTGSGPKPSSLKSESSGLSELREVAPGWD